MFKLSDDMQAASIKVLNCTRDRACRPFIESTTESAVLVFTAATDTKGLLYLELALSRPLEFTSWSRPLSGTLLSVKVVVKVLLDCSCVCFAWRLKRFNCSACPLSLSASSTSVARHCHSVPFLLLIPGPFPRLSKRPSFKRKHPFPHQHRPGTKCVSNF